MAMLKKLKRRLTNSEGVVAIIVALLLVLFVGMMALVVDMGSLYEDRTSLQSVADAAALAGAQELPVSPSQAIQEATDYITKNRADIDIASMIIEISSTMDPNGIIQDTIKVTVNNPDSPIRFNIYGDNSTNVRATATAMVGSSTEYKGCVPWYAVEGEWEAGEPYDLYLSKSGSVSFNGESTGGDLYRDNIANGYDGILKIGDTIECLNGFKTGPTIQGTESRVGPVDLLDDFDDITDPSGDGFKLSDGDSQLVMIPIVSYEPVAKNKTVPMSIIGFAPLIITFYDGKVILGKFLTEALVVNPGDIGAVDATGGVKVVRLIQ